MRNTGFLIPRFQRLTNCTARVVCSQLTAGITPYRYNPTFRLTQPRLIPAPAVLVSYLDYLTGYTSTITPSRTAPRCAGHRLTPYILIIYIERTALLSEVIPEDVIHLFNILQLKHQYLLPLGPKCKREANLEFLRRTNQNALSVNIRDKSCNMLGYLG